MTTNGGCRCSDCYTPQPAPVDHTPRLEVTDEWAAEQ